jgi:hypothetical protein
MTRFWLTVLACMACASGARADDPVLRRGGEWQVTTAAQGALHPPSLKRCFGPGRLSDFAAKLATGHCAQSHVQRDGDVVVVDMTCPVGPGQASIHDVITLSGDTAYHSEMHMTYTPPVHGLSEMTLSQDGKWLGACAAGEAPLR